MNLKVILLVVCALVGGYIGFATTPKSVSVSVGDMNVEIGGSGGAITATGQDGAVDVRVGDPSPMNDPMLRTVIFAVVGAAVGFAAGYFVDRRRA